MTENNPLVIGITGYPGTGKSTLAKIFKLLGCPVQNADQVVDDLLRNLEVIKTIQQFFPNAIDHNRINKSILADIVFQDPQKLKQLEAILHPLVYAEHQKFIEQNAYHPMVALEIPLLFETGSENLCSGVIYTTCRSDLAWERIKRRGWSRARYQAILERMLPDLIKREKSQFVVDTSLSKVNTWHQLKSALKEICNPEELHA